MKKSAKKKTKKIRKTTKRPARTARPASKNPNQAPRLSFTVSGSSLRVDRGGRRGGEVGIDPPAGDCERIDCCLSFTGSTANDMEIFVTGRCATPCTCELWVQDAYDKPWYSKGPQGRVKLKDYSGYAAVCAR